MASRLPFPTPSGGIPIPQAIHVQFPENVQAAWLTFHTWLMEQERPLSRKSMPVDVAAAYEIMKNEPIPEHEGYFGRDSCYVVSLENEMIE